MIDYLTIASNPLATLNNFHLDDLRVYTREGSFPQNDSADFREFYVGRDDVHGVLKYILSRCSRSVKFNQFGYDDDELDALIQHLLVNDHVYVQGTLDKSQAGGVHERKILANWSQAMRNSVAVGQSATHQISHTKGGVADGVVAWTGSTNWSTSGEGTGIVLGADGKQNPGFRAQNNTLTVYVHPVRITRFSERLDEEHAIALRQQVAARA